MAHKGLIALDSSEGAWRAVEYVAETLGQTPGVRPASRPQRSAFT